MKAKPRLAGWSRISAALRRDWAQTKADLFQVGFSIGQTAADTIRQIFGVMPIPPLHLPAYAARSQKGFDAWFRRTMEQADATIEARRARAGRRRRSYSHQQPNP